ncbi:MAG: cytochrome c biogenesis protein CcdA [Phycisphaerales bacterium JB040]
MRTNTPTPRHSGPLRRVLALLATGVLALTAQSASAQLDRGSFGQPATAGRPDPQAQPEVTLSAAVSKAAISPGDTLTLAIIISHREGWHTNLNQPVVPPEMGDFPAYPTTVSGEWPEGFEAGPIQWPEPHAVEVRFTGEPIQFQVYEGEAPVFLPVIVGEGVEPGTYEIPLAVSYQACDDIICLQPTTESLTATVEVVPLGTGDVASSGDTSDVFASFDPTVFADRSKWGESAQPASPSAAPARTLLGVIPVPPPESPAGVAVLFLLAMLGGFVLNLTPCVLPVIPIKIMTISSHADSKGRGVVLGSAMALGVIAFWVGIGLPVAFLTGVTDPSMLFGIWWVTIAIGLLIAAMGVGIMGVFQITLPQKVYAVNPKADSLHGSFLFGVMTAVLGLPCFGFVAGALLAGAATMPAWLIMTIFTGLGAGMALPYLVLASMPRLVDKLPRTGPASELVKQVMGLLLLAAAAYFLGAGVKALISERPTLAASLPWWVSPIHWWFVALFALAAGGWLAFKTFAITKSGLKRATFTLAGLLIGGVALAFTADQTVKARNDIWTPYTESILTAAANEGRVVVLDFTAEWCLNCKTLEATVLSARSVRAELDRADVIPVKADLTSTKAEGWAKLRELGQTGIPLLVVYGPGRAEPWLSNAYTPEMVVNAIREARGESVASR